MFKNPIWVNSLGCVRPCSHHMTLQSQYVKKELTLLGSFLSWQTFFAWPNLSQAHYLSPRLICVFLEIFSFSKNVLGQFNQNLTWLPRIFDEVSHPPPHPGGCLIILACVHQDSRKVSLTRTSFTVLSSYWPPTLVLG